MCWTRADALDTRLQSQTRKVEERQQIVVADVEKQVRRAFVVAVLHQLDQRKAEQLLVELDRLLDVAADERHVVDAARAGRRPLGRWAQVFCVPLLAQRRGLGGAIDESS